MQESLSVNIEKHSKRVPTNQITEKGHICTQGLQAHSEHLLTLLSYKKYALQYQKMLK